MQIPATSSASQAASIAAQSAAKDVAAEVGQAAAHAQRALQSAVEKSNESSPDRDAQGQGDGLSGKNQQPVVDELEIEGQPSADSPTAAQLPDQPPSQLDIVG